MKCQVLVILALLSCISSLKGQTDTVPVLQYNMSQSIINSSGANPLTMGVYAQLDYNQVIETGVRHNGNMDVHRFVTFLGYRFNDRTHFVSEIEIEHVKEIYLEQAFLNYRIRPEFNIRGGLMLIPMGIINEYHEPTTFNGVERPNVDKYIVPSTWREMGLGLYGRVDKASLRYQAYVVNGFLGYDGEARLDGTSGFRSARQKGAESTFSHPNLSVSSEYYGISGLKLGLAFYSGKSQSTLYDGISIDDLDAMDRADSSSVGLTMLGLSYRYAIEGFTSRGQWINATIRNSDQFNTFTGADLGSAMNGYYVELGYDILHSIAKAKEGQKLTAFVRYEYYNTQYRMTQDSPKSGSSERQDITSGIGFHITPQAVFKIDYQWFDNISSGNQTQQINSGIGIWF